ncbi:MAG: hypothetical protein ACMG6S_12855 [Byssovorax sp.]
MALLVALASPLGCNVQPVSAPTPPAATPLPAVSIAVPTAMIATAAPAASDCVELGCRLFDTPADAFRAILESKPLVIAIGEAHAQKGTEGIPSSAKRFTGELLPLLEGRASDLLVELMAPPAGCKKITEEVKTKQKVVTEKQTESAQSEYVIMGNEARKRGMVPDLLRPSCADLDAIDKAGAEAIGASLATIARLTKTKIGELLDRNAKAGAERIVATYGGAMHNDLTPPPERAAWSFGPDLSARAAGRYVEIDLFVPEFIQDTESWKKLPWYPHFDRDRHPEKTTLFNPRPGSYVLIFPRTPR